MGGLVGGVWGDVGEGGKGDGAVIRGFGRVEEVGGVGGVYGGGDEGGSEVRGRGREGETGGRISGRRVEGEGVRGSRRKRGMEGRERNGR